MVDPSLAWYAVGVTVLAIPVHALIRRFEVACPLAAALAALIGCGSLIAAAPGLKPGWAVPVAGVAFVIALPISFVVGKAAQAIRRHRARGKPSGSPPGDPVIGPNILPEQEPRP